MRREGRLTAIMRALVPSLLTVVLMLFAVLPYGIPGLSTVMPMVAVMAVYYWSLYRPELMPAWAAFLLGLLQDLLCGTPLGSSALVLVCVQAVCVSQRRAFAGHAMALGWLGFVAVASGATALTWVVTSLLAMALVEPRPAGAQLLLTVALYPLFDRLFSRAEQRLLRPV